MLKNVSVLESKPRWWKYYEVTQTENEFIIWSSTENYLIKNFNIYNSILFLWFEKHTQFSIDLSSYFI